MISPSPNFTFVDTPAGVPDNSIVIADLTDCASITSNAETVVLTLLRIAVKMGDEIGPNQPPMYYFDSDGSFAQLQHDGQTWTGFGKMEAQP